MDHNPKHFPTVLTVCIIMAIIFYITSHLVYYFHQQHLVNNVKTRSSQCSNEEEND